ncbi:MAG: hypothetical protein KME46_29680 [Brasilonema angustatum HA4187-MV1]|jgi:hypothetical protein|nr:hypothetical protein [Brasilonema angustatum HA4187-MV1]
MTTEAIASTNSVVLRDGSLIFTAKPLCAWAYFLFIEKSQMPGETGNPRAIGSRLAQAWLFSEAYTLNSEPLTEIQLNILSLTMREANRLLVPLTSISVTIDILDDADTLAESTHVKIKDHEYTMLPIPWEAADKWLADVRVSVAQAYKNMAKGYIRRDGDRITDDMFNNPEILGIQEGKLFFEWVKYAVN